MENRLSISILEEVLYEAIKKDVCKHVYVGAMPQKINSDEFVVIDASFAINNNIAYAYGDIAIRLFCKPLSNGMKNVGRMKLLEEKMLDILNIYDKKFTFTLKHVFSDYDENANYFANIILLQVKIS